MQPGDHASARVAHHDGDWSNNAAANLELRSDHEQPLNRGGTGISRRHLSSSSSSNTYNTHQGLDLAALSPLLTRQVKADARESLAGMSAAVAEDAGSPVEQQQQRPHQQHQQHH